WAGDHSQANEGSPFFLKLFKKHPLAAAAGEMLWAAIILTWVLLLPEVLAVILTIAVVFGHTAGGYTRAGIMLPGRLVSTLHGVLIVSAIVLGGGVHWALRGPPPKYGAAKMTRLHPVVRWGLLAFATATACYMFLIPQ